MIDEEAFDHLLIDFRQRRAQALCGEVLHDFVQTADDEATDLVAATIIQNTDTTITFAEPGLMIVDCFAKPGETGRIVERGLDETGRPPPACCCLTLQHGA